MLDDMAVRIEGQGLKEMYVAGFCLHRGRCLVAGVEVETDTFVIFRGF